MWNLESLAAHIARQFYSNMFEEGEPHSSPVEFSNFSPGFGPVFLFVIPGFILSGELRAHLSR